MKKTVLIIFMIIGLLAGLSGCQPSSGRLNIVASVYPIYCMAVNLTQGAPGVKVSSLSNLTSGCAHDYQLTSADRRAIADANLVIINGAGLETFLTPILPSIKNVVVDSSRGLDLPRTNGRDALGVNPHTWVSIPRAISQMRVITDALKSADAANADIYERNFGRYRAELDARFAHMEDALAPYNGAMIITLHPAFDYFAEDFGLIVAGTLVLEPEAPPSARELSSLIGIINANHIRVMFVEPGEIPDSALTVRRETGVGIYQLDPATVPLEGVSDKDRYLNAMDRNLNALLEALR